MLRVIDSRSGSFRQLRLVKMKDAHANVFVNIMRAVDGIVHKVRTAVYIEVALHYDTS